MIPRCAIGNRERARRKCSMCLTEALVVLLTVRNKDTVFSLSLSGGLGHKQTFDPYVI